MKLIIMKAASAVATVQAFPKPDISLMHFPAFGTASGRKPAIADRCVTIPQAACIELELLIRCRQGWSKDPELLSRSINPVQNRTRRFV
jgi:hypothetical protein